MAMFLSYEIAYLLRWSFDLKHLPKASQRLSFPNTTIEGESPRRHMTEMALGLGFAIEFPLIVAFHPWTMYTGVDYSIVPIRISQTVLQILLFYAVEAASQSKIVWFFPPCTGSKERKHTLNGPHSAACGISLDYLLPKATLFLAIGLIWMTSVVASMVGKLQMSAVIVWVVTRQFWSRSCSSSPEDHVEY